MAAKRLTPEEASFISSLRALLARGGSLDTMLVDRVPPIAAVNAKKSPASVVEPRNGYWLGNPEFSRSRVGLYPVSPSSETIIENTKMPGPPRGRGIILQRRESLTVAVPTTQLNYAVRARIQFGIGGQTNEALIDWANTIVNVPGSLVRVNAEWENANSTQVGIPYNVGNPVEVTGSLGVQLTADPLVNKGYNTLTTFLDNGGVVTSVQVPSYAVGFWCQPFPPAGAATGFWYAGNTTDPAGAFSDQAFYLDSHIVANGYTALNVLPPGARTLYYTNTVLPINAPLVWAIGL
jgi:hypothetical protein